MGKFPRLPLAKAITAYPRPGWIRATGSVGPEVTTELSRLSKENAELRESLTAATSKIQEARGQEEQKVLGLLSANTVDVDVAFVDDTRGWTNVAAPDMAQIFLLLAPELFVEKSAKDSSLFLAIC